MVDGSRAGKVTLASRELGRKLRAQRKLAGLSQVQIARALEVSQSTVQRVEAGAQLLGRAGVEQWLTTAGGDDDARRAAHELLQAAHGGTWTSTLATEPVPHLQGLAARRETEARRSCSWTPDLVPGLLQTAAYASATLAQMDPTGAMDVAAGARARVERQQVLFESGHEFRFLLGEEALRWSPAPGVMAAQLNQLLTTATLPTVEVAVLPTRRHGTPAWHGFVYREPSDGGPAYVTLELVHAGPVVDDPEAVALYRELWATLWAAAVHGDDAAALVRATAADT